MKLRALDAASRDLIDGCRFYEKQPSGLGSYFLDSLYSDIDSLQLYVGMHAIFFNATIVRYPNVSHSPFGHPGKKCLSMQCWIAAEIQPGSGST